MEPLPEKPHAGDILRRELKDHHWSHSDLAKASGLPSGAVDKILSGGARITEQSSIKLGKALGKTPEYFWKIQESWEWELKHGRN